MNPMQSKLE